MNSEAQVLVHKHAMCQNPDWRMLIVQTEERKDLLHHYCYFTYWCTRIHGESFIFKLIITKLTATLNEMSLSTHVGISQKRSAANLQVYYLKLLLLLLLLLRTQQPSPSFPRSFCPRAKHTAKPTKVLTALFLTEKDKHSCSWQIPVMLLDQYIVSNSYFCQFKI